MQNVARYLKEIDRPTPLILIEALVVDYDDSVVREIGIAFGRGLLDSTQVAGRYRYDTAGVVSGEGRVDLGPGDVRQALQFGSDLFGLGTVGRLPADFYARIRALESQGQARVLSRPQISTLSGHPATISVGTTQYYILRTSTPVSGGAGGSIPYESERFEKVEANVKVEVTPWVSTSGEVIATIRPEFSTPVGRLTSSVPPTINTRVLEANVRLRDGETIILGGLIQETEAAERTGVPFLSRHSAPRTALPRLAHDDAQVGTGDLSDAACLLWRRTRRPALGGHARAPQPHRTRQTHQNRLHRGGEVEVGKSRSEGHVSGRS